MFDGKIFFGVAGTPIRNTARVKSAFAEAEPVPFTLAKRTTKSLILVEFVTKCRCLCSEPILGSFQAKRKVVEAAGTTFRKKGHQYDSNHIEGPIDLEKFKYRARKGNDRRPFGPRSALAEYLRLAL